jgi:hypothetical protein
VALGREHHAVENPIAVEVMRDLFAAVDVHRVIVPTNKPLPSRWRAMTRSIASSAQPGVAGAAKLAVQMRNESGIEETYLPWMSMPSGASGPTGMNS